MHLIIYHSHHTMQQICVSHLVVHAVAVIPSASLRQERREEEKNQQQRRSQSVMLQCVCLFPSNLMQIVYATMTTTNDMTRYVQSNCIVKSTRFLLVYVIVLCCRIIFIWRKLKCILSSWWSCVKFSIKCLYIGIANSLSIFVYLLQASLPILLYHYYYCYSVLWRFDLGSTHFQHLIEFYY